MSEVKIVLSDLDGTLKDKHNEISSTDENTFINLGSQNIVRTIATGRSIYSAKRALHKEFPIDYLIFSNGAGVYSWKDAEVLYQRNITRDLVNRAIDDLTKRSIDFMVHEPTPENHRFHFAKINSDENTDFEKRIELYNHCTYELNGYWQQPEACQLLAVIPVSQEHHFFELEKEIDYLKVIRTTSPFDQNFIWIEFFPPEVSKASAAEWLIKHLEIEQSNTLAIGNDYNDIELLDWAKHSYMVENCHEHLTEMFKKTNASFNNGFTTAVKNHI